MRVNKEQVVLSKANIASTPNRVLVLRLFLTHNNTTLSLGDILNFLCFAEKSTIFRTLQLFEAKEILHSVVSVDGIKNYALCTQDCIVDNHTHLHGHLKCKECSLMFCTPMVSLPVFETRLGVKIDKVQIIANGTCKDCNQVAYQ